MAMQFVGVLSAIGIVAAFAALQFDLVGPHDPRYLGANLVCAGLLTSIAVLDAVRLRHLQLLLDPGRRSRHRASHQSRASAAHMKHTSA